MIKFVARRFLLSLLVLWGVVTIVFFVVHITGDPLAQGMQAAGMTQQQETRIRHTFGLDRSLPSQYATFIGDAVQGNFGTSFQNGANAMSEAVARVPNTLKLAAAAMLLTILIAGVFGIAAAYHRDSPLDRSVGLVCTLCQSVPAFVAGPVLIIVFAVTLHALPVEGTQGISSLVLPSITLALYPIALTTQVLRASVLEVRNLDFVRAARARGIDARTVARRHVLRNALLPAVTVLGLQTTYLLGGAVIVEAVFAWNGIGALTQQALAASDFPVVQALVVLIAAMVIITNFLVDVLYAIIDPRIRY